MSIVYKGETSLAPKLQEGNTLDYLAAGTESSVKRASELGEDIVNVLFTKEETISFLSGKTVIWGSSQGLYYGLDFTLIKIWNGVRATGTWSVSDEGAVCWHVPGWDITPCEFYYFKDDELMAVYNGVHSKADEHVESNMIGSF